MAKDKQETTGFGQRLRALRLAAGMTQESLAGKAGMRYQLIAKYERGATEPTWATVLKLADALGVDVGEFRKEE